MRIFVAGAGFTGTRIVNRLHADGHAVICLNRSGNAEVPEGVRRVAGDVLRPETLGSLDGPPPVDLMISTLSGTGLGDPADYRALYVDGPRRIAERLRWTGPSRVWMLGSTGVYGEAGGALVDEDTPAEPLHRNGEVQLEAEQALRNGCDASCVLRLSGLYGPGRVRMVRQALRRRPYFKPDGWANQIHGDDVAGVVAFLASRTEPPPPLLLVSDDRPARRREIFDWIRAETGHPEGCIDEDHPRAARNRGDKRVDNRRLRSLGAPLRYPGYREGYRELLP